MPQPEPVWTLSAATARGVSHQKSGNPNEDAYACATRRDGSLILAAADGAGSASHAAEGSSLAVTAAVEHLSRARLPLYAAGLDTLLLETLVVVRRVLNEAALEAGLPLRAFASTLLLTLVTRHHVAALQLGDGAILARTSSGDHQLLSTPLHGRYAGETVFITSNYSLELSSRAVVARNDIDGLALLTDGLEAVALNRGEPFAPFFTPLFNFAASDLSARQKAVDLGAFLESPRICERTHDDKTLLLAVAL